MNFIAKKKKQAKQLGVGKYFTGKPCKHGHTVERYACSGHCVKCQANKKALEAVTNKDKIKAYQADWYQKNKVNIKIKNAMR